MSTVGYVVITALAVVAVGLAVLVAYAIGIAVGGGGKPAEAAATLSAAEPIRPMGVDPETVALVVGIMRALDDAEWEDFEDCLEDDEGGGDGEPVGPDLGFLDGR